MRLRWVLVNCHSLTEGRKIGEAALKKRFVACYDLFPRVLTRYFWPPRRGSIESGSGCLLVLETLPRLTPVLVRLVKSRHLDTLPFIGSLDIGSISPAYYRWLRSELRQP